jgi:16S rRNA (cytosine967-C5)-methyltransferase
MNGKGQLYICDIRKNVLYEAKKRFNRANIQNYQFHHVDNEFLLRLKNRADWILLDVPCSGSGIFNKK